MPHMNFSVFTFCLQAVRVLKSSRSLTITVLTGAVSTLSGYIYITLVPLDIDGLSYAVALI